MALAERRKIEELVALYQLEPNLRDVFVEGSIDAAFFEWFFRENGVSRVAVREVDDVDVSSEFLGKLNFNNNRRGRVMALAHTVEAELGSDILSLTCVIDRDFDRALGKTHPYRTLLSTDYSCLEGYLFAPRPIGKFLRLVVRRLRTTPEKVLQDIGPPLVEFFAIRLAKYRLEWKLELIDFERCCEIREDGVDFDSEEYITRFLNRYSRTSDRPVLKAQIDESRRLLAGDARQYIHGHDFINMLSWYLRQHKGCSSISPELVERSLYACAEYIDVSDEPMFRALLERVKQ